MPRFPLVRLAIALLLGLALLGPTVVPSIPAVAQGDPPVRINEFVAANESGLTDNTGATEDWIELHNTSASPVDLVGWTLTAGTDVHTFASITIPAGGYLIVFASGEPTRSQVDEPHLDFKLDADGEALVLAEPGGAVSTPSWPGPTTFPGQVADISYGVGDADQLFFFDPPTPDAANPSGGLGGIVAPVTFSAPAGFYSPAQTVTLDTVTPSATIRYTTDGSTPTTTNGTVLAPGGTVAVSQTTVLRAVAYRSGWVTSPTETRSYFFLADILTQGSSPPSGWPSDNQFNGQDMDYGMDPNVVNGNQTAVSAALTAIPTISIVTDLDNLFDQTTGIYVNASNRGAAWERPASIELIDPSGAQPGFDINGGVRMRGGFSRSSANPKHSLRLFFRDEYEGQLDYSLFGDEGLDNYEKVDLRTSQNYAWSWRRSTEATFMDELWSRDTQGAMGQPYTRSRQYHVYLNGQYWGIYMTQERVSGDYAERYFGGDNSDYDVVKRGAPAITVEASDGDLVAWQSLYSLVSDGNVTNAEFDQIAAQVDLTNLADYYLLHFFTGDFDGSPSWFFSFGGNRWTASNNWYALRERNGQGAAGKWVFFDHDSEHSLCASGGPALRENIDNTTPWVLRTGSEYMSPAWLHQALISNASYRQIFADRVQLHMVDPGGALTVAEANARLDAREAELTTAVLAESARWGDGPDSANTVYGVSEWQNGLTRLRNCFADRQSIVQAQLTADGLWPQGEAPTFTPTGGALAFGDPIAISADGQPGTIYFTVDGTDPRGPDGQPSGSAVVYSGPLSMAADFSLSARILEGGVWTPVRSATYVLSGPVGPPRLLLNEYNAVDPGEFLGGGTAGDFANGSDSVFGRVDGNGGDWFELVVLEDRLDVRGWTFEIDDGVGGLASLTLSDAPELSELRAGTLITISESIADDLSYFPPAGDWHINLQSNDAGDGAFVTAGSQTGFETSKDDTTIAIFDELGLPEALATGEPTAPNAGVNDEEVFKLETAPTSVITPDDLAYNDGTSSTWGEANVFSDVFLQDLSGLRIDFGDADCDGDADIVDALVIVQLAVGLRTGASCPLGDPATQAFVDAGDVNADGASDIVDALLIAQCDVGIANPFCPQP
ncbi:MAG: CotH kinase family protein [Actinomycetota bacterium]